MDVNSQLMMPTLSEVNKRLSFSRIYTAIINETVQLIHEDHAKLAQVRNERTGELCHTFTQGISFSFDMTDRLAMPILRKFYPGTAAAEAAWFIRGEQDATWIKKHCPIWDDFTEADGKTIKAAYGYRWRKHFGRDQLMDLVLALVRNPSDRRTVLCAWDPGDDGLMHHGTKNVPCPFAMSFYIVNGKLMMSYYIRSSDLYVGLPYDVLCTDLVCDAIIQEIRTTAMRYLVDKREAACIPQADLDRFVMLSNLQPGSMTVTLGNPHLYDNHVEFAQQALEANRMDSIHCSEAKRRFGQYPNPLKPQWSITQIEKAPDSYVDAVKSAFQDCVKSSISQRPDVAV